MHDVLNLVASYDDYLHHCRDNAPRDETTLQWTIDFGKQVMESDKRPVTFSSWCFLASYPEKLDKYFGENGISHVQVAFDFIYFSKGEKRNIQGFNANIAKISLFIPRDMLYMRVEHSKLKEVYTKVCDRSLLSRWEILRKHFEKWGSDGEYFIALHDGIDYHVHNPLNIEILTFGKNKFLPYTLIPDIYYLSRDGYMESEPDMIPWEQKKSVMYWRGSSTGGHISWENWKSIPRIRLASLSLRNPSILDAKLTSVVQIHDDSKGLKDYLEHKGLVCDRVPFSEFHRYKFLINVDGNSCAWDSMFLKLKSNCVVFHVDNDNIQWYYDRLVPWKHYIPIKPDFSDLFLKFEWALNNDSLVKKIAHESSELMVSL